MKLFFFDYDGTLYQRGTPGIPPRTEAALKALQQAGHKIILCTGRCEGHFPPDPIRIGFDGFAGCCGASLYLDGVHVVDDPLDQALVHRVMQLAYELQLDGAVEGIKRVVFYNKKAPEARFGEVHTYEEYLQAFGDMTTYKFTFNNPPMPDAMRECLEAGGLYIINNNNTYYEVVKQGQLKGKAVRDAAAYYGVSLEDTFSFGDSTNDSDMLRTTPHSMVVNTAPDYVTALATELIPPPSEEGVAQWIEKFLQK